MQLTDLQIQHFDTFGFLLIRDFLDDQTVQNLRAALDSLKTEESGETDTIKHCGRVLEMFNTDPTHIALFDDLRLHAIATTLLRDPNPRFLGDEYASFSTGADWHPDTLSHVPYESLKFGFYLDDVSRGGFLRVVPGSHNPDFSDSIQAFRSAQDPSPEIDGAHICMTQPGDLLIFNLKLWHQGTINPEGTHRRVIFWSLGQDHPTFREFARDFHTTSRRGEQHEPWPDLILKDAPPHRRGMLDVYEPDTVKQQALV